MTHFPRLSHRFASAIPATILLLWSGTASVRAASLLEFFFPVENARFNTEDDEIVVLPVRWGDRSQDLVLYDPGGQAFSNGRIPTEDVVGAIAAAADAWNEVPGAGFEFGSIRRFSSSQLDPPLPTRVALDRHNLISFRDASLNDPAGDIAAFSLFFMERAVRGSDAVNDDVEGRPVDFDGDGRPDYVLENRNYAQGEILECDILFNGALDWQILEETAPGALDIQAVATHLLGRMQGIAPSYIVDATMFPAVFDGTETFPTDPMAVRTLHFDDMLAASLVGGAGVSAGTGEIVGQVADGAFLAGLPEGFVVDSNDPLVMEDLFLTKIPVYLGRPASNFPPGVHPDNVGSGIGTIRLLAQVFTGRDLRYPAGQGGVSGLEPSTTTSPNIDFDDRGEDLDGDGFLDPGEDLDADGELDRSTRKLDGIFVFPGLPPATDYVVHIDEDRLAAVVEGSLDISPVVNFLGQRESYRKEFFGGSCGPLPDDFRQDLGLFPSLIEVTAGATTAGIDILTNVEDTETCPTPTPSPTPSPTPTPPPLPSSLANLSTRGFVGTDTNVMIGGFIVEGGEKTVLVSGIGPDLANFGVADPLADPELALFQGQTAIATNANWRLSANHAEIEASGYRPGNDLEAAILTTLAPGAYTAKLEGAGGGTGVGLVQVFDLGGEGTLSNLSTRLFVGTEQRVMIAGLTIDGEAGKKVLLRGIGPSLGAFGIPDALADPVLGVFLGQTPVAANDNWIDAPDTAGIRATGLAPFNDLESALLIPLPPGSYTAVLTGRAGTVGTGLVEIYEIE